MASEAARQIFSLHDCPRPRQVGDIPVIHTSTPHESPGRRGLKAACPAMTTVEAPFAPKSDQPHAPICVQYPAGPLPRPNHPNTIHWRVAGRASGLVVLLKLDQPHAPIRLARGLPGCAAKMPAYRVMTKNGDVPLTHHVIARRRAGQSVRRQCPKEIAGQITCGAIYRPAALDRDDPQRHHWTWINIMSTRSSHTTRSHLADAVWLDPWKKEIWALLKLGGPLVATQVTQFAILTVDAVMVGRLGQAPLAAAALGTTIYFFGWLLGFGPVSAVAPVIAQAVGERPNRRARVTVAVRMGIWASFIASIPMIVIFGLWSENILLGFQQPAEISAAAAPYIAVLSLGLPFAFGQVVMRNFVSSLSKPNSALAFVVLVTGLNIVLNWMFIYGNLGAPRLELVGAGVASALANCIGFFAFLFWAHYSKAFRHFDLLKNFWRPHYGQLKEHFVIGLPIGMTVAFEGGLFNAGVFLMGTFGTVSLAAHHIAVNVASMTFMVALGLSLGGVVRVGLAAGAGNAAGIRRAGYVTILVAAFCQSLFAFFFVVFPHAIISIYVDIHDPENAVMVAQAVVFLKIAALFQIFDAIQVAAAHALRGLKDTRIPMVLAGFSYWAVGFPTCWVLAFNTNLDGVGIWWGYVVCLFVASIVMTLRFWLLTREAVR